MTGISSKGVLATDRVGTSLSTVSEVAAVTIAKPGGTPGHGESSSTTTTDNVFLGCRLKRMRYAGTP